jgi:hypothetical protein
VATIEAGVIGMLNEGSCIVLASTPARGKSGIANIRNGIHPITRKKICREVDFDFNCPACRRVQADNPGYICVHNMHLRPHSQNMNSVYVAQAAYGANSDAFRAEMMGSSIVRDESFLSPASIARLRDPEISVVSVDYLMDIPPHYVYVSIDPSGASRSKKDGETSDYAFVTAFVRNATFVVSLCLFHKSISCVHLTTARATSLSAFSISPVMYMRQSREKSDRGSLTNLSRCAESTA